jgi:predicted Zn-dependent protease
MPRNATFQRRAAALALPATLALGGCASHTIFNPVTERAEVSTLTESQLAEQAEQAREALLDEHGLYPHAPIQAYVTEIGLKMARLSHRPDLPWSFACPDGTVKGSHDQSVRN